MPPRGEDTIPVCIVNDTRVDRHHGCFRVMTAIETLLDRHGFHVAATCPAHASWETNDTFMHALENAKLIVVNGEGTLHHDRPAGRELLRIGDYAKARGIPAALINAGWEANGPAFLNFLNNFSLIAARDSVSAREMRQGGRSCAVVPDLSLFGAPQPDPVGRSGGVVFSDSVDRFKAVGLENCRRAANGATLSIVYPPQGFRGYLKFIREAFAGRDVFTPLTLVNIIRARHRLWRNSCDDIAHFIKALSQAELLVSGRFHACTLALTTATPFVAIPSNTGKIAALIADAGLESWRADAALTPAAIEQARAAGWSGNERSAVRDYLETANENAEALFRELRKLV